ncbi:plasmid mobilization relaxosome protein MobC [Aliarcobacter butzleri]|uniref:plasmid mobilization relaxosome protein MobC n=1 Tax=Aliarcobacter butzleri TaxID=28197 RepID=UPI002B255531|nr:plasmid mobilization relaxosome protein MobC [Aliarcobacter butzleri]
MLDNKKENFEAAKKRKAVTFRFRLSVDQRNALEIDAKKRNFKSSSEYVIFLIKQEKEKTSNYYKETPNDKIKVQTISSHLSRIGNNLNQIAYNINKANLKGYINEELAKDIANELMYLNIQISELLTKK